MRTQDSSYKIFKICSLMKIQIFYLEYFKMKARTTKLLLIDSF